MSDRGDLWDRMHKARFERRFEEADEVTCEDCGETFPTETEEQRQRLSDGCPNCNDTEGDNG